jgi:hypothetical protein
METLDTAAKWLAYGWVPIVVLVVGFLVVFVLVCLFEKQPCWSVVPIAQGVQWTPTPYHRAMDEMAARCGFTTPEHGEHIKGGKYQVKSTAWYSADRHIVALVGSGRLTPMTVRKTLLLSITSAKSYVVTCDEGVTRDITGINDRDVVMNADFYELLHHHQERLDTYPMEIDAFETDSPLHAYQEFEYAATTSIVARGYGRFGDPAQTYWRCTLRGALAQVRALIGSMTKVRSMDTQRIKLPRPGDRGYVARG